MGEKIRILMHACLILELLKVAVVSKVLQYTSLFP